MRRLLIALLLLLTASVAQATTWNSPSCSQVDVQNTINANTTVTGDTVQVLGPCGPMTWASFVTIPSTKGITVAAVGSVTLSTTSEGFIINAGAATTRVTGFTCLRPGNVPTDFNGHCFQINAPSGSATYIVDHNIFCAGGGPCTTANTIFVSIIGLGPGLFHHNNWQGNGSAWIQNFGDNNSGAGWLDMIVPGGPNMVFWEDETFTNPVCNALTQGCQATNSGGIIQSYYGARNVMRHSKMTMVTIDQHGSANGGNECSPSGSACIGAEGVRWWEFYNLDFEGVQGNNPANQNQWFSYMDLRAGTGVVHDNTFNPNGVLAASNQLGVRLREENTLGWPQAYQAGSGIGSNTSPHANCGTVNTAPAHFWNNTGTFNFFNSPVTGNVQQNRDYFIDTGLPTNIHWMERSSDTCTTTYTYAPYPYPHPLQNAPPPTPAVSLSRSSIAFGNQNVSTSSANVNTVVTNTGTANLTISSVAVTGTDLTQYSINTNTCTVTITPGATCSFNTVFSPTSTGAKNAFATVTSNAPTSPNSVTLSGTGTNPITVTITVQPSPLSFGNQIIGQVSTPVTVTVASTGTGNEVLGTPFANFTAGGVNPVPGDFALAGSGGSPCSNGLSLAPGTNCTFSATITATQAALETATLNVNGTVNATIQASGTGIPASPVPAPSPQIFSTVFGPGTIDLVIGSCPKTCKIHLVCTNCTTNYTGTIQ